MSVPLGEGTTLPIRFFLQLPPGSACSVAALLDQACGEFARSRNRPVYGVYLSTRKIARLLGLGESTVRTQALPWLAANGWIELQKFTIRGRTRTMIWAKWRFPAVDAEALPRPPAATPAPGPVHARMAHKSAPVDAPIPAQEGSNEFNSGTKKTTVGESSSFIGLREVESCGDRPPAPPCPADRPTPPRAAIPVEPRLAELLGREVDDVVMRAELGARSIIWVAQYSTDWVDLAIREMLARAASVPIPAAAAYVDAMLRDWKTKGNPTPRLLKARAAREAAEAKRAEAEARSSAEKTRARRKADEGRIAQAALDDRWAALPEARKQEIREAIQGERPDLWRWAVMRQTYCIERMIADEGGA